MSEENVNPFLRLGASDKRADLEAKIASVPTIRFSEIEKKEIVDFVFKCVELGHYLYSDVDHGNGGFFQPVIQIELEKEGRFYSVKASHWDINIFSNEGSCQICDVFQAAASYRPWPFTKAWRIERQIRKQIKAIWRKLNVHLNTINKTKFGLL